MALYDMPPEDIERRLERMGEMKREQASDWRQFQWTFGLALASTGLWFAAVIGEVSFPLTLAVAFAMGAAHINFFRMNSELSKKREARMEELDRLTDFSKEYTE